MTRSFMARKYIYICVCQQAILSLSTVYMDQMYTFLSIRVSKRKKMRVIRTTSNWLDPH